MAFKLVVQRRNLRVVTDKSSVSAYVNQAPKVNFEITNYLKPQVAISFRNVQATDILLDAFNLNRRFFDTLSISEQLAFELNTAFTDSYGFADTTSILTAKSFTSSYGFDHSITNSVDKGITDNVSFNSSASVLLEYLRGFDDSFGFTDEVLTEAVYLRELTSAFTLDDFLTAGIEDIEKVTEGNKGNIFGLVSEIGFDLSRFVQSNTPLVSEPALSFSTGNEDGISSTDEINLSPEKSLASNYNLESSTAFVNAFNRTFGLDDVALTDAMSFDLPRGLADTASISSENANSISKPIHIVLQSLANSGGNIGSGIMPWDAADIAAFIDQGRANNNPPLRSEHEHLFDGFSSGDDYLDSLNFNTYDRAVTDNYYDTNIANNSYLTNFIYDLLSGHEDEDNFAPLSQSERSVSKTGGRRFLDYSTLSVNEFLDLFDYTYLLSQNDSTALSMLGDNYDLFDRSGTGTIQAVEASSHLYYWGRNNPNGPAAYFILQNSYSSSGSFPRTSYISNLISGSDARWYQGTSLLIADEITISISRANNSIPNDSAFNASTFN